MSILADIDYAMQKSNSKPFLVKNDTLTGLDIRDGSNDTEPDCFKWNLYNSVFFSFTAVTTIGMTHSWKL